MYTVGTLRIESSKKAVTPRRSKVASDTTHNTRKEENDQENNDRKHIDERVKKSLSSLAQTSIVIVINTINNQRNENKQNKYLHYSIIL